MDEQTVDKGILGKLWGSTKVGFLLWIISGALALYWYVKVPATGKAIAELAVVAGLMSVRKLRALEVLAWLGVICLLFFDESRAIDRDRSENDRRQAEFAHQVQSEFATASSQAAQKFSVVGQGMDESIASLKSIIEKSNRLTHLSNENLDNVTGGTSLPTFIRNVNS